MCKVKKTAIFGNTAHNFQQTGEILQNPFLQYNSINGLVLYKADKIIYHIAFFFQVYFIIFLQILTCSGSEQPNSEKYRQNVHLL